MHPSFQIRLLLPTLCLLTALGIFATSLYLPSLPSIGKSLSASQESVQLTLALFFLGSAFGSLLLGPLADHMGRLIVAKGGIVLFILASIWCANAQTITDLQIARFLQGMAASAGPLVARAMGRDLYEGTSLTHFSATIMMVVSLSPAIAPTLGGVIETYFGWDKNFYFLALFAFIISLMVWLWLPETNRSSNESTSFSSILKNYALLFKDASYGLFCLVIGLQMGSIFCYITMSPYLYISHFNWSPQEYGYIGITSAFGNIVGFAMARYMAHRLHFHQGILIGSFACFIVSIIFVSICLIFDPTVYLVIFYSVIFYGFSALAVVYSSAGAMNLFSSMAGVAAAMVGAVQIGAGVFGSVLASSLPSSPLVLAVSMTSLSFLSFLIGVFIAKKSWLGR
ncbi:MAG: Bcr/CflA family efflux MFS transporter [Proteobacteria bacterium]|nr:Bcr/CflA family efflux MFS transporter [Pseudomonadota bacterium]